MANVSDTTECPVCRAVAQQDFDTDTNEITLDCDGCGFRAETEVVTNASGKKFWLETRRFPMDEDGRVIRGLCVAQLSEARCWVPSLKQTVTSIDKPADDAEFIKNVAYRECGKPGVQWNDHANIRSEDGGGWLCADHAESIHEVKRKHECEPVGGRERLTEFSQF
jgi:hypothetical protein